MLLKPFGFQETDTSEGFGGAKGMPIRFSEFSFQEMGSPFLGAMAHEEAGRSLCVSSRLLSIHVAQKSKVICQLARRVAQPSIARGKHLR